MQYTGTIDRNIKVNFKQAVLDGVPSDGGLYVPDKIPVLTQEWLEKANSLSGHDLAFDLLLPFVEDDITESDLKKIIQHTFHFKIPIHQIGDSEVHVVELFHGPTWAFKDVGAGFLAGCLSLWSGNKKEVTILVATSGDTGGAVAQAFFRQAGVRVVVLFPKGKISPLQEMQIAGLGDNIKAVAVNGSFDDCQRMVKQAFADRSLKESFSLTSANSINVARWLPQMVYYAFAWQYANARRINLNVSVPSGNYGNIAAGMLLHQMGMQFREWIAAHNENDTIPRFLHDGKYEPHATINTLANAMDVSDPGNFSRLIYIWEGDETIFEKIFKAKSVSDENILKAIKKCWDQHHYLLDPHTATAWYTIHEESGNGFILSTAHPYKFEDVIQKALGFYPDDWKKNWIPKKTMMQTISTDYQQLKDLLSIPS